MKSRSIVSILAALATAGCGGAAPVADDPGAGAALSLGMSFDVPPATETWKCRIMPPLQVEGGVARINRVKHVQTSVVHHMDLMVLLKSGVKEPPGDYNCADLYRDYPLLMEDTNLYAAQTASGEVDLPKGV